MSMESCPSVKHWDETTFQLSSPMRQILENCIKVVYFVKFLAPCDISWFYSSNKYLNEQNYPGKLPLLWAIDNSEIIWITQRYSCVNYMAWSKDNILKIAHKSYLCMQRWGLVGNFNGYEFSRISEAGLWETTHMYILSGRGPVQNMSYNVPSSSRHLFLQLKQIHPSRTFE